MTNENYNNSRGELSHNAGRIDSHEDLQNMGLSSDYDGRFYDHAKVKFDRHSGKLEADLINTHAMDNAAHNMGSVHENLSLTLRKKEDVQKVGNYIFPGLGDLLLKAYSMGGEQQSF